MKYFKLRHFTANLKIFPFKLTFWTKKKFLTFYYCMWIFIPKKIIILTSDEQ